MKAGEIETCRFFKTAHDIHRMDCLPGRSFHQVIDGRNDDEPGFLKLKTDVAVIRPSKDLGFWKTIDSLILLNNTDKGFFPVNLAINFPDVLFRNPGLCKEVDASPGFREPFQSM